GFLLLDRPSPVGPLALPAASGRPATARSGHDGSPPEPERHPLAAGRADRPPHPAAHADPAGGPRRPGAADRASGLRADPARLRGGHDRRRPRRGAGGGVPALPPRGPQRLVGAPPGAALPAPGRHRGPGLLPAPAAR